MSSPFPFITYLIIPALASLIFIFFISRKNKIEYVLKTKLEDLQGRINIAYQQVQLEESRNRAVGFKLKRYDALAALTDKLNQSLSLDDILDRLIDACCCLLGHAEVRAIVYLNDAATNTLSLARAKGKAIPLSIKEKQGDIFDQWVLKHRQPLLVEDTSSDFRFDFKKTGKNSKRRLGSLISTCLITQDRPKGILRLESIYPGLFNLEDLRLLSSIADIASIAIDNCQYYQRLNELAIKDSLTNLYTRSYLMERFGQELSRFLISEGSLSLMMLDIDYFKQYNDQYGHLAGDIVLKNLALTLTEYFKKQDALIGRFGGEEFLIILPLTPKEEAFSLAENLRWSVQGKKISLRRKPTSITISVGVSNFPRDAQTAGELLNKADIALYEAKRLGRNRVCLF